LTVLISCYRVGFVLARMAVVIITLMIAIGFSLRTTGHDSALTTLIAIRFMNNSLMQYAADTGRWPDPETEPNWVHDLEKAGYGFLINGFGVESGRVLDWWDRPFVFDPPLSASLPVGGAPPFVIYSVGINGIDEQGGGDDLSLAGGIRPGYYWKRYWPLWWPAAGVFAAIVAALIGASLRDTPRRAAYRMAAVAAVGVSFIVLAWMHADGRHLRMRYWPEAYWAHVIGVALLVSALIDSGLRKAQRSLMADTRRERGLCASCSYDLTGLTTGRCPECGTENQAK